MTPRRSTRLAAKKLSFPSPPPSPKPRITIQTRSETKITKPTKTASRLGSRTTTTTTRTRSSILRITRTSRLATRSPLAKFFDESARDSSDSDSGFTGTDSSSSTPRSLHSSDLSEDDRLDHCWGDSVDSDSDDSRFGSDNETYFDDTGFVVPDDDEDENEDSRHGTSGYEADDDSMRPSAGSNAMTAYTSESESGSNLFCTSSEREDEDSDSSSSSPSTFSSPCPISNGAKCTTIAIDGDESDGLPTLPRRLIVKLKKPQPEQLRIPPPSSSSSSSLFASSLSSTCPSPSLSSSPASSVSSVSTILTTGYILRKNLNYAHIKPSAERFGTP